MIAALPGDIFRQGQILNNTYEIEGALGRGGTGEVYRARNLISGRIVAIKALNSQFSGNDDYIELMKREEQMRDILNDAVVRYTECSRSDQGHVFLVMDFIDGPSMADVMAERRMDPRELMIIAHRVAEGLVAAHGHGIVHRDLSPDNVVLRGGEPAKATIIDFGIAKDTAAGARTIVGNDFAGKYEYAAPEQLEGRAEPRSDLYALGALLLAGFRGQVPFSGATPGEMIRRKQAPLDVAGVPDPLRKLILWLTEPKLESRAPSAAAVVAQIGAQLKPATNAPPRPEKSVRRRGWLVPMSLVVLLLAAGGLVWRSGAFDSLMTPALPMAAPWTLAASAAGPGQTAALMGHAPDAATATALASAFQAATGTAPAPDALTLATGMPSPGWPVAVSDLFTALAGVEGWQARLSDSAATISGLAPSRPAKAEASARLAAWAAAHGFALSADLAAGPRELPFDSVAAMLETAGDCGALAQSGAPGSAYPLGAALTVTGPVAAAETATDLQLRLRDLVGDRDAQVNVMVLNPDLCAVRRVLPVLPSGALSIWLGHGATGEANLAGVFHTGDNPVVEVLAPGNMLEGRLWVAVVDNTGKVFNVLPSIYSEQTALAELGTVENGLRRVRVLHALAEAGQGGSPRLAIQVSDGDFGKSEVIAILSRGDLFETRRPRDESVAAFAEALAEIQKTRPGNIIGMATRILDARP